MMHKLIPAFLLTVMTAHLYAQASFDREERTFYGALAFGGNTSQVDGDGFSGYHKVGLNFGPAVYARFGSVFGASLELNYTQKGSKARVVTESVYVGQMIERYDLKLNYVEIPVMLHIFPAGRFHYSAGAGYARLISSKESAVTIAPVNLDPDLYPFKKTDISIMGGGSFHFSKHWLLNARLSYSLGTVREPQLVPQNYGGGRLQKNNVVTLRLLYLL